MKKRKNRIIAFVMMLMMTAAILGGCSENMQTDEVIVVPKEETGGEASGIPAASGAAPGSILSGISEQVQALERYQAEFSEGSIHVKVDAPVIIPAAAGFKLYKVTGRVFTQEDYDNVNHVLLKDGKLWERDHEQMEASNGFTRSEIEERIAQLKEQQAGNGESKIVAAKEKTYEELIGEWEELLKEAPEEPIITEVPAVVCYSADPDEAEKNYLSGNVTVDGKDFFIFINNELRDDVRWVQFEVRGPEYAGTYIPGKEEEKNIVSNLSPDKIREEAKALITSLGFDQFALSGEEYVQIHSWNELANGEEHSILDTGYEVHFTRELNGIPVTYTHEQGTTVEEEDDIAWPYEKIDLVYNETGLQKLNWENPYQVEEAGEEYVFLLPFSDIQSVFEKVMPRKDAEWMQEDASIEIYYDINEIRLGYMRIREKDNAKEGTMVPVWDFLGSETIVYSDVDAVYVHDWQYESLLTINAMDGTVINRGFGY